MKSTARHLLGIAVLLSMTTACAVRADLVYDNSTVDLNTRFNPGLAEVGDEIVLGGSARYVTDFTFQYWGLNFSGNEQARIRFYANDGAAVPAGPLILMPGTLLFDSDWFGIVETNRATLIFTDFITGAVVPLTDAVPDSFTWSIQFQNLGDGASAGVDLYDPPGTGGNYNEYWDNDGVNGWQYRGTNAVNINFAAKMSAVPEPTIIGLGLLGGIGVLLLRNRMNRR